MKNRILAAMALCCATSSTMPLWAAEYDDPTIVTVGTQSCNRRDRRGKVLYLSCGYPKVYCCR